MNPIPFEVYSYDKPPPEGQESFIYAYLGSDGTRYQAVCKRCHYTSGDQFHDHEIVASLLKRHQNRRSHKTNSASPTRFTL